MAARKNGEDIYQVLKQDHEAVAELFEQIEATTDRAQKTRLQLFEQVSGELLAHAHAEQAVFYQALLDRVDDRDMVLEAFEEHGVVESLIKDIEGCDPSEERWLAKVTVLKEMVEHHVEEEEKEMFRAAKKVLSNEEARELAERMQEQKSMERA